MNDDVGVVDEHPTGVLEALPRPAPGSGLEHGLIDRIDDRSHLTVVITREDEEDVGQGEPLGDVDRHDALRLLLCGGAGGDTGQGDGVISGGHGTPWE